MHDNIKTNISTSPHFHSTKFSSHAIQQSHDITSKTSFYLVLSEISMNLTKSQQRCHFV